MVVVAAAVVVLRDEESDEEEKVPFGIGCVRTRRLCLLCLLCLLPRLVVALVVAGSGWVEAKTGASVLMSPSRRRWRTRSMSMVVPRLLVVEE